MKTTYLILQGDEHADEMAKGITLIPANHPQINRFSGPGVKILKMFEAETWDQACQIQHDFFGWEPYIPSS